MTNPAKIGQAMNVLRQAMKEDPGYALSWWSNISVSVRDAAPQDIEVDVQLCIDKAAEEGARRFMKLAFEVEIDDGV